jgi:hypothetical protein
MWSEIMPTNYQWLVHSSQNKRREAAIEMGGTTFKSVINELIRNASIMGTLHRYVNIFSDAVKIHRKQKSKYCMLFWTNKTSFCWSLSTANCPVL